jgi:hypothetical protein
LVVGYSGEASLDVYRVVDLIATRLASKHLENVRTPASIAKAMQPSAFSAPGVTFFHVDSRGSSWIACGLPKERTKSIRPFPLKPLPIPCL